MWKTKPDLIIETGIAHGGSLIFSSSLLALLDIADGRNPRESPRKVVGIDIDIRRHNREAIERHPLAFKIGMFEGSSIDQRIVDQVALEVQRHERVMVILDSNHTHDHVLQELRMYSPFVSSGLYLVVFDTVVEHLPDALFSDRPWSIGDNPMTAVKAFLATSLDFDVDQTIDNKLLLSVAPSGYLIKK